MPRWTTYIKRLLYPLYVYPRSNARKRQELHQLYNTLRDQPSPPYVKIFSNEEEDGIILWLLAKIDCKKGFFLDIGSNDCINSNCANLALNFGWSGVFIDADKSLLSIGKLIYFLFRGKELKFISSFLTEHNTEHVVRQAIGNREVDFMNIDIDGNDYAIWRALQTVTPKIVVIENKIELGLSDVVISPEESSDSSSWGASLWAMTKLANAKGYELVATNNNGFNAFYLRKDLLPTTGLKVLDPTSVPAALTAAKAYNRQS